jgi:protein CpxP
MKSSVKLLVSVLALGLMTSLPALRAQDNPPPAGGQRQGGGGQGGQRGGGRGQMTPAQQIERLETAVGKLTDDQKTKITAVYEKLTKDMQALAQEDRRTKGQELRTAAQKDVRALLTPEQQTKFDAMPAPGRGGQGGGQRRGGGGGGGN